MTGVVIIPFRKGSSLKDKPFQMLGDQTLLARTIQQAQCLHVPILLYTDYRAIPSEYAGTATAIMRNDSSGDEPTEEAMRMCLAKYASGPKVMPDVAALMTVNTPVKPQAAMLECWHRMAVDYPAVDSSFFVEPIQQQVWRRIRGNPNGWWDRATSGTYGSRQTKGPEAYIERSGVFCVSKTSVWLEEKVDCPRVGRIVEPVVVTHPHVGLDIHTERDLEEANALLAMGSLDA